MYHICVSPISIFFFSACFAWLIKARIYNLFTRLLGKLELMQSRPRRDPNAPCFVTSFTEIPLLLQTPEESQKLKVYTKHHNSLSLYSDKEKVVQLLSEIEELVTSGT